jgi:integrase
MNKQNSTPNPNEWHRKPVGEFDQACAICGYPAKHRGEHRATLPTEGFYRQWVRRVESPDGGEPEIIEVGNPHGGVRRIRDTTREHICRAARMFARGRLLSEIAAELGVTTRSLENWRAHHPSIWRFDYHQELKLVEQEAAELPEPRADRHLVLPSVPAAAADLDNLTETQRLPLLVFLRDVYLPSRLELGVESIGQMEVTVRLFQRWAGREIAIGEFSESLIRSFLTDLRKTRKGATVNAKRCHLLAIWWCAYDEEVLDRPPRKIRRAACDAAIPEAWTPEEVGRILEAASETRRPIAGLPAPAWWLAFLLTIYDTGERRGAVLAATPADVDLDEACIVFYKTKTRRPRFACILRPSRPFAKSSTRAESDCSRGPVPGRRWLGGCAGFSSAEVSFGRAHGGLFHKLRRTSGTLVEAAGGDGARHIGNTRAVFEGRYLDPRFMGRQGFALLPRPVMPTGPKLLTHDVGGPTP